LNWNKVLKEKLFPDDPEKSKPGFAKPCNTAHISLVYSEDVGPSGENRRTALQQSEIISAKKLGGKILKQHGAPSFKPLCLDVWQIAGPVASGFPKEVVEVGPTNPDANKKSLTKLPPIFADDLGPGKPGFAVYPVGPSGPRIVKNNLGEIPSWSGIPSWRLVGRVFV